VETKRFITYADSSQRGLLSLTAPHFEAYADHHNYEFSPITDAVNTQGRSPHWAKILLLQQHLLEVDVLLWCDCDIVLRAHQLDMADEFHGDDFQALCMENAPQGPSPNTGVWIMRNTPEAHDFLQAVWETGPLPGALLNDQATTAHLLGFSYLPYITKPMYPSPYLARTGWLDHRWNMLTIFHPEAAVTSKGIHFGGMPTASKQVLIEQYLDQMRRRDIEPHACESHEHPDPLLHRWSHPDSSPENQA
jgi:hypothetical protein